MNTLTSSAKQIAQTGITPVAQATAHMAIWIGLTPQDLKQSFMQFHQGPGAAAPRPVFVEQEQAQVLTLAVALFEVDTFFLSAGKVFVFESVVDALFTPTSFNLVVGTFADGASVFSLNFTLAYAKL